LLAQRGWRVSVRRAYGGLEKLAGMRDALLRHGVRGFVNHGKGTTDALLVVDAMDLLHAGGLPSWVVIASSDADFAPLAVRLRESGLHVLCIAQGGKAAMAELGHAYDEVIQFDHVAAVPPVAPVAQAAAPRRASTARRSAPARAPAPAPAQPPSDPVWQLLHDIPGFAAGQTLELNDVVKRLRDAKMLGKTGSGPKFLHKHAPFVELIPQDQPNKLRLRPRGGGR
jgi:hypothetical protein